MERVAVIGVGSMGRPMAENLLKAGFRVNVCDLREEALAPFRAKGVPASTDARDSGPAGRIVIMVGNDADVAEVVGKLKTAIDPARPPLVAIMSSVLPRTIKQAAAELAPTGAVVIDAPVSGGPVRAAEARMSIMAGGDDASFARAEPMLQALGQPIFRCGPVGAAASVKIVNNILGVSNMLLMTEAAHLATSIGIDLPFLLRIMEVSSGRNYASGNFAAFRALTLSNGQDLDTTSRLLAILKKDLGLASTLSGEEGVAMPVLQAVAAATRGLDAEDLFARWQDTLGPFGKEWQGEGT